MFLQKLCGRLTAPVFFTAGFFGAAPVLALPQHAPVPGGVAVLALTETGATAPQAWLGDQPLAVTREGQRWYVLVGIALDTPPGQQQITVTSHSQRRPLEFTILSKNYPSQYLSLRDQSKVTPSAADLLRIEREQEITERIKRTFSATPLSSDFSLPARAVLSSRFGVKRFFNGQPRNPHAGLDLRAKQDAAILAPASGTVLDTGNYFFNGNTVFLDHGQGLISAYMHLSRIEVRVGQKVSRGSLLGAAGATGRATGPHLHWAIFLNGTPVNPELFLKRQ